MNVSINKSAINKIEESWDSKEEEELQRELALLKRETDRILDKTGDSNWVFHMKEDEF